jgi:hypothetical protein
MGKVLEVSEETYQQLTALAAQQHRTPDERIGNVHDDIRLHPAG